VLRRRDDQYLRQLYEPGAGGAVGGYHQGIGWALDRRPRRRRVLAVLGLRQRLGGKVLRLSLRPAGRRSALLGGRDRGSSCAFLLGAVGAFEADAAHPEPRAYSSEPPPLTLTRLLVGSAPGLLTPCSCNDQIGNDRPPPNAVAELPRLVGPSRRPDRFFCQPANQASFESLVVPVLP
jgi:hypothetical protein